MNYNSIQLMLQTLSHNVLVHIYSSPNFALEICINFLMCIVHYVLLLEVNNIIRKVNIPPLKLAVKESLADVRSKSSIYHANRCNHPDFGVDVIFNEQGVVRSDWDTTAKINKILSTSLSEYVRCNWRNIRHVSDPQPEENIMISTDRMYYNLLKDAGLKEVYD